MKKSSSVGIRPILVLSYKNHAIDEFLVDLVRSEGGLSGHKMIDSHLKAYSEGFAYDSNAEVKVAHSNVDHLNILKDSI